MLPCVCSVIDRRGRQNVVSKNISDFDGVLRQQHAVLFLALMNEQTGSKSCKNALWKCSVPIAYKFDTQTRVTLFKESSLEKHYCPCSSTCARVTSLALQTFQLEYSGVRSFAVVTFSLSMSVFCSVSFPRSRLSTILRCITDNYW